MVSTNPLLGISNLSQGFYHCFWVLHSSKFSTHDGSSEPLLTRDKLCSTGPPSNCQPQPVSHCAFQAKPDHLPLWKKPLNQYIHWILHNSTKIPWISASIKTSSLPIFRFKTPTRCISRSPYGCNNVYDWKVKNFENKESRFVNYHPSQFNNLPTHDLYDP